MRIKAKVGMKIHVFSPDKEKYLGIGEIIRVEPLIVEDEQGKREVLSNDYPIIKINNKEIGGLECWWYPIDDHHKTDREKQMEKRFAKWSKGRFHFILETKHRNKTIRAEHEIIDSLLHNIRLNLMTQCFHYAHMGRDPIIIKIKLVDPNIVHGNIKSKRRTKK